MSHYMSKPKSCVSIDVHLTCKKLAKICTKNIHCPLHQGFLVRVDLLEHSPCPHHSQPPPEIEHLWHRHVPTFVSIRAAAIGINFLFGGLKDLGIGWGCLGFGQCCHSWGQDRLLYISPKHWFDRGLGSACLLAAFNRCIGSPQVEWVCVIAISKPVFLLLWLPATFRPAHGCCSGRHWCTPWLGSACLSIVSMVFVHLSSQIPSFFETDFKSYGYWLMLPHTHKNLSMGEVFGDLIHQKCYIRGELGDFVWLSDSKYISLISFKIDPTK